MGRYTMRKMTIMKPAVPKSVLLFLAGFAWFCVGIMLLVFACRWLSDANGIRGFIYFGLGFAAALLVHRFGFQKIAAKNINRLLPLSERRCVFSFFTWKSYLLIAVMVVMGRLLRSSAFPKPYLAVLYIAIGLALIISSLKYLTVFMNEIKGTTSESTFPAGE